MPYTMDLHAHGACRHASLHSAATVVMINKSRNRTTTTYRLPPRPAPTTQRAQLNAIIFALKDALAKAQKLRPDTPMQVSIHTSSKYVVNCMTQWLSKWTNNGFRTCKGKKVKDRDLLERALGLVTQLRWRFRVQVEWVWDDGTGEDGEFAEMVVEAVLDQIEGASGNEDGIAMIWENWERGV